MSKLIFSFVLVLVLAALAGGVYAYKYPLCKTQEDCAANAACFNFYDNTETPPAYHYECIPANAQLQGQEPYIFNPPTQTTTFAELVCSVTNLISRQLLPPLAVLMTLVVGFLFLMSGGDPGKAANAKKTLMFTALGVVALLLAPAIVALIADLLNTSLPSSAACGSAYATNTIITAFLNLVNWFSWLVALAAVVMGLYGGFLFITARDDPARAAKARQVLAATIIGIAVAIAAFSIISIVRTFLS
ncbi:MAG: hypothetical protein AAB581_02095 [Patescibacteria group bacterium]